MTINRYDPHRRKLIQGTVFCLLWIALFCVLSLSSFARAATIPWQPIPYSHVSRGEKLADVLRNFGVERGVVMVISETITQAVNGSYHDYSPDDFFTEQCQVHGLIWFFDGTACYVYSQLEIQSKIIPLGHATFEDVEQSIRELGISDHRIPIRRLAGRDLVYVIGSPKFLELAETATTILDQSATNKRQVRKKENIVQTFFLKHAWATDHKIALGDDEIMVPGVATELMNLLGGNTIPEVTGGGSSRQLKATLDKLRGTGMSSVGREGEAEKNEKSQPQKAPAGTDSQESESFSIQADARLNAVIVRDSRDRMNYYEELIRVLDTPASLINIEVTIAEIGTGTLRELGVQWRYENTDSSGNVHDFGFNATDGFQQGANNLGVGIGLNLATTLSLSAGEYLLSKLHALENKGEATILSKPSLLTLDNIQAIIQETSTFYTKVPGFQDVDLFKVTSGLILKVRPHIIKSDSPDESVRIKLLVDIEDGAPDSQASVDNIPVVNQSSIHTQAVVESGETLLLGGNIYEKEELKADQIPLLGDIPILGYLFKFETKNVQRLERIFMIRPTLYRKGQFIDEEHSIKISELIVK
jgi:type III secretion protein C